MRGGWTIQMAMAGGVAALLACGGTPAREQGDTAGCAPMTRDTTMRDTTVVPDTLMTRDTALTGSPGDSVRDSARDSLPLPPDSVHARDTLHLRDTTRGRDSVTAPGAAHDSTRPQ